MWNLNKKSNERVVIDKYEPLPQTCFLSKTPIVHRTRKPRFSAGLLIRQLMEEDALADPRLNLWVPESGIFELEALI